MSFQKGLDTPGQWAACSLSTAAHALVAPDRAWEGRRVRFARRRSGPARRCRGRKLQGPGARGSGTQNVDGALGLNLGSESRASGGSSRRRRAGRGPGSCCRTVAAPGPARHDRAEPSGFRAPLMPCRPQPASGRAQGIQQRAQGPRLGCKREPAPVLGSNHCSGTARFPPSRSCPGSRLLQVTRSGGGEGGGGLQWRPRVTSTLGSPRPCRPEPLTRRATSPPPCAPSGQGPRRPAAKS